MRPSAALTFICLALGVAPSFSLASICCRGDQPSTADPNSNKLTGSRLLAGVITKASNLLVHGSDQTPPPNKPASGPKLVPPSNNPAFGVNTQGIRPVEYKNPVHGYTKENNLPTPRGGGKPSGPVGYNNPKHTKGGSGRTQGGRQPGKV
ncbi:hypothetical protein F5148DRAFT_1218086 [Russula earlei]|uniref:Uncharacterized protein n=1 Tax=Russula earlei TaxID=71964 RepID=A0ACC0U528_9AGAM|nr:hypothetical protein F5148DRAFT_1218086 [Russula earlei]